MTHLRTLIITATLGAILAGCSGGGDAELQQERQQQRQARDLEQSPETVFDLFRATGDPDRGVVVNRFLWQASLDTLSFLPLQTADPFSGLIVTDWGALSGGAYKVTVFISEPALDARSLKVAAFRQSGGRAVAVGDAEARALEDAILTRARQLRIADENRRG